MASIQLRSSGFYRIIFKMGGKRFFISLKTKETREANATLARLEENLHDLERGKLQIPLGADPMTFLLSDGKLQQKAVIEAPQTLEGLFEHYLKYHPEQAKEANTRATEKIHMQHFKRILGPKSFLQTITTQVLQQYVETRFQEKGRHGKPISQVTVKKEIGTFASIWNRWALAHEFVKIPAPTKRLIYRKTQTKPHFQTWEQIERQIARGGLSKPEQKDLWDSLFLTLNQIQELLEFVEKSCPRKYVFVMFCFAAFTGARRSEMLRSRLDDFDFDAGTVTIREKKRDRSKDLTFRTVPLTPAFRKVMEDWLRVHPGGQHTICMSDGRPLAPIRAAKTFRSAVNDSKWDVLRGWHVLRHSFASNCAMKGVDQRIIDAWMGHTTEEMRQRYRHLFPNQEQEVIRSVFW